MSSFLKSFEIPFSKMERFILLAFSLISFCEGQSLIVEKRVKKTPGRLLTVEERQQLPQANTFLALAKFLPASADLRTLSNWFGEPGPSPYEILDQCEDQQAKAVLKTLREKLADDLQIERKRHPSFAIDQSKPNIATFSAATDHWDSLASRSTHHCLRKMKLTVSFFSLSR